MKDISKQSQPNTYIEHENYMEMYIISPKYGEFHILFDKEDYEKIKQYKWCINKCMNKKTNVEPKFYTGTSRTSDRKQMLLHRFIMNAPKNMVVDHINHIETR